MPQKPSHASFCSRKIPTKPSTVFLRLTNVSGLRIAVTGLVLAAFSMPHALAGCFADSADCAGLTFDAAYTGELWANTRGGLARGEEYIDNLGINVEVDANETLGIEGGTLLLHVVGNNGAALTGDLVGDAQTVSNIEAETALRLYEGWYEQAFWQDLISLKVGLYDLNSEFDALETASLFINGAHGIGLAFSQTGQGGPSLFPNTAFGGRLRVNLTDEVSWLSVVLDGVPGDQANTHKTHISFDNGDGALITNEIDYEGDDGLKLGVGVFHYTDGFDDQVDTNADGAAVRRSDNTGFYLLGETLAYRETSDTDEGLRLFARYGFANEDINQFKHYVGAGLVYTGLFDGRDEDQAGFGVGVGINGDPFKTANAVTEDEEIDFELTYRAQITPWLALQPDVQYVVNPGAGANGALDNALVVGLRFEITPFQ
ncbi:MAG: carbohydrate porin [Alphaproteobacteria bacterium]|jgi:porin|nr:carbohydrate porin [Alphaproteobacteria bacterium]MDP6238112.1 carbohydrate porin [Alphaproteobacteria bacterium]MDP7173109.1 carbohydrate porin [Alphaproteobacteria bacterium]MDP7234862.1 carbohydrate porin [Alphaproteobacteria bacterium]MDP7487272.1 carbohydrate porin [Alphaproteobacteria bacterium]